MQEIQNYEKYVSMPIDQIEQDIRSSQDTLKNSTVEYVSALCYLERTNRFRENQRYKSGSFNDYVYAEFGLRYHSYAKMRNIICAWPEQVGKYGYGTVMKIRDRIGPVKAKALISLIEKKEDEAGKPIPIQVIDKMIQEAPQRRSKRRKKDLRSEVVDWKERYERLHELYTAEIAAHNETKERLSKALAALEKRKVA